MDLPGRLKRRHFESKHKKMQEEIRVLKERSNFLIKKIVSIENKKVDLVKKIRQDLSDLDYPKLQNILQNEFFRLIQREELPATKNLNSVIYNHVQNIKENFEGRNPDSIIKGAGKLIDHYRKMQELIQIKIADIEDEIRIVDHCLRNGIPIAQLTKLNEDEMRESGIRRRLEELKNPFKNLVHKMEQHLFEEIREVEGVIKNFESRHGPIERLSHAGHETVELAEKVGTFSKRVDMALFMIEGAAALFLAPEALAGIASFHFMTDALDKGAHMSEALEFLDRLKNINTKLDIIAQLPNYDPAYGKILGETRERYREMRI